MSASRPAPAPQQGGLSTGMCFWGCISPAIAPRQTGGGREEAEKPSIQGAVEGETNQGHEFTVFAIWSVFVGQEKINVSPALCLAGYPSAEECQDVGHHVDSPAGARIERALVSKEKHFFPAHTLNTLSCSCGCRMFHAVAFFPTVFVSGKTTNKIPEKSSH